MGRESTMRLLVTTSVLPRWEGDATPPFVLNLCRDLADAGCRITLLAPHSKGAKFHEEVNGLTIRRYPYLWPLRYQTICYEGGMLVRGRGHALRKLQIPALALAQYIATMRALQAAPYSLLHAHSLLPQGWIAGIAAQSRLPLVISSHGADVFLLPPKWDPLLRRAVARADALIANSSATAKRLHALGASPEKIHRIPATPNYPDPDYPIHAAPEIPTLLFAGRLIPEKGPDLLLEAMPAILQRIPACRLRIAGDGALRESLQKRTAELGLADRVTFTGWLPPDALRAEMAGASLLVAPSRMIEGQNLVVTEALSVGCPVATTPRGGVLDLIQNEKTGIVIPESRAESIAKIVGPLLLAGESLGKLGRQGYQHFNRYYSRKKITRATLDLYQKIRAIS